ncbi:hypothetical protein C8Q76DRAFT_329096 [Earliella scabrosa]|nr:hypothetical protein C8Q76DRAFT_329096 [Earliella scabrosa]
MLSAPPYERSIDHNSQHQRKLFTAPLTCILVNRLLLKLQAAEHFTHKRSSRSSSMSLGALASASVPPSSDSVFFHRIVGSIGSAIEPDVYSSRPLSIEETSSDESVNQDGP